MKHAIPHDLTIERARLVTDKAWEVWNTRPVSSVIVCIRPLVSVSCTLSPGRSGPRRFAAPVAVMPASVRSEKWSGG